MQSNICHVVHLMLENRGFDTLLGWLYADGQKPAANIPSLRPQELAFYGVQSAGDTRQPIDASYFNSAPYNGKWKDIQRGNWGMCYMPSSDPGEPWDDVTEQIYGPNKDMNLPANKRMRGFWLNYGNQYGVGSTDDILATATPDDLPVMNTLARSFAVSDMWFSSAPTQTNPNRAFSLGGSSQGIKTNGSFTGTPYSTLRTILSVFSDAGVSWKLYADHYWKWWKEEYFTEYMFPMGFANANLGGAISKFEEAVATDTLPTFTYLEPTFFSQAAVTIGTDYHPPGSLYQGEKFLKRIYDALRGNPTVFNKTLFIVTFDEHGGCYDHVTPPENAPVPDDQSKDFNRYGVRVPTLLISPWVKPGTVFRGPWYPGASNNVLPYDHTSVLATLMNWKNIDYKSPTCPGWLLKRTAVAPTFEEVITNQKTSSWPDVKLFSCSVTDTLANTGAPRSAISAAVTRITGSPPGDPQHKQIMDNIEANVTSEDAMTTEFQKLMQQYGDRPR